MTLRDEYGIQIEFGDIGNILAIISVGDSDLSIERLISALYEIKRRFEKDGQGMFDHEYIPPIVDLPFKKHFMRIKIRRLCKRGGQISGEYVMCYPRHPDTCPGERITREIIDYTRYAKDKAVS